MRSLYLAAVAAAVFGIARADEMPVANPPTAAASPTVAVVAFPPIPDGGIYLGWGGGLTPGATSSGLAAGSLVIDRHLFWRMGLWISGETFFIPHPGESDLAMRLCIGARIDVWRSESRKVRVITDVAFTHQHEAVVSLWRDHPFENLLGESKFGLGHRSGVEAGVGILLTPFIDSRVRGARRLRVLLRASGAWMPDSNGPNFYLALLTSVGVAL